MSQELPSLPVSEPASDIPRFTLEAAAVLSLLVQRQREGRSQEPAEKATPIGDMPTEIRLRSLQDFAKRLFGIQIDLRGSNPDAVLAMPAFGSRVRSHHNPTRILGPETTRRSVNTRR